MNSVPVLAIPSTAEKMKIARERGIAIFDWSTSGGSFAGSAIEAAKNIQKQIDAIGLQDVTIVSHSKGAVAARGLLEMYQNGNVQEGAVKNMVLIDPPQQDLYVSILTRGSTNAVDANKAGVKVVFMPGSESCRGNGPCGTSTIGNVILFPYVDHHHIRGEEADRVFDVLGIDGDAHARTR